MPLYWLVYRDSPIGLLESPIYWVVYSPIIIINQQGFWTLLIYGDILLKSSRHSRYDWPRYIAIIFWWNHHSCWLNWTTCGGKIEPNMQNYDSNYANGRQIPGSCNCEPILHLSPVPLFPEFRTSWFWACLWPSDVVISRKFFHWVNHPNPDFPTFPHCKASHSVSRFVTLYAHSFLIPFAEGAMNMADVYWIYHHLPSNRYSNRMMFSDFKIFQTASKTGPTKTSGNHHPRMEIEVHKLSKHQAVFYGFRD